MTLPINGPEHHISYRLEAMWKGERWHKIHTSGWIGDAIYGVNDGLGAIFGIIAGVAGYTDSTHTVLISGLFGALASTLSMGAGAWLATKSETELQEKEIAHERREIQEDPEHELEELILLYQLKGLSEEQAREVASQVAEDEERFVRTMAQEELGIQEVTGGGHWRSALIGSASTLVGGIVPLIPLFFVSGTLALVLAGIISILAHFAVGAAKSRVTSRSWWTSGLEMTWVGVIVGVVAYGLGIVGTLVMHA